MNDLEKEIQLYLYGEMTSGEKMIFEEKINSDPQLQKDINTYQEMYAMYNDTDWNTTASTTKNSKVIAYEAFLKSEKGRAIANSIKNTERTYFEEKSTSDIKKWILYAVSVAAILIIGFFIVYQSSSAINGKSLYAEYKNWNTLPSLTLRDENTALATAEKFFRGQNYQEALDRFLEYQQTQSEDQNPQIILYIGIAQLELDQDETAIQTFEKLLHSNTLDASKANWYLALAYLKMNKIIKAKEKLQIIIDDSKNDQYEKAIDLFNSL
jgi:tetratricopeptide (TPR) repeat protein